MNIVEDDIFLQVSSNNIHKTTTASSSNGLITAYNKQRYIN